MRTWILLGATLALLACDDGEGGVEPARDLGVMGGEGGEGGQGEGGAGEGGQGGQGEGGEGGEGGQGEGGQGGQGAGGEGGQGAGGEGGEGGAGEGGAGGGMGACVPECPVGSVCDAGTCRFEGCPEPLFECDGVCVDLLTDAAHCGSCGNACAAQYPEDPGLPSLEATQLDAICADAQCSFACGEAPDVGLDALASDPQHCGACGAVCDGDPVNADGTRCVDFQCTCQLTQDARSVTGAVCGDRCQVAGDNCEDGCCPTIGAAVVNAVAEDGHAHHYVFTVDDPTAVRFDVEGPCARATLLRYYDNGSVRPVAESVNCSLDDPALAPGQYGLTLRFTEPSAYRLTRSAPAIEPLFIAPDRVEAQERDGSVAFGFTVQEAGGYWMRISKVRGNDCGGVWSSALYDAAGRQIFGDEGARCNEFREAAYTDLIPGDYVFVLRAREITAFYAIQMFADNPTYAAARPQVEGPGVYPQPAIERDQTQTILIAFAEAGVHRVRTAGVDGAGCPGDTVLSVGRRSRQNGVRAIAHNDDADMLGCSAVEFEAAANTTYTVEVSGYDGLAVDAYGLVLE